MKYFKRSLLTVLLCVLLTTAVFADVLPWPDNDFFQAHEEEVSDTYSSRSYVTYGASGSVNFYEAPGSGTVVFSRDNLERVYPSYFYESDGMRWGIIEDYSGETYRTGWCRMEELLPVYDSQQFMTDHTDELGGAVTFTDYAPGTVCFYSYPGSGVVAETWDYSSNESSCPEFDTSYTDSEGRQWGHVSYYMWVRDCWMCISAPYNDALPFVSAAKSNTYVEPYLIDQLPSHPTEATESLRPSADSSHTAPSSVLESQPPYAALAVVGVAVILAALGIYLLGRRNKANRK